MPTPVPIVDYLVLGDTPHLVAHQCTNCEATYFDHRDACANCFKSVFSPTDVSTTGQLQTYTIVAVAAPGVEVPFVAGVVDCQGVAVRASIVNVAPTPEEVHLGMPLRLTTFEVGVDDNGTKAMSFGFEPFPTATNEDNA